MRPAAEECVAGATELALYELLRQRLVKVIAVPAPGAGLNWSQPVTPGSTWELLGVQAILATSAVVAARLPQLQIVDPDLTILARLNPAATQAAGATATHSWWCGYGTTNVVSAQMAALPTPPQLALAGHSVRVSTGAIDVGDQWSSIFLWVREWSPAQVLQAAEWIQGHTR